MSGRNIINLLGGIRPLARRLDEMPHTTVQGWRDRNAIPSDYWSRIIQLAAEDGIVLSPDHFLGWTSIPQINPDNDNQQNESAQQ